jgi:hypothetical protein
MDPNGNIYLLPEDEIPAEDKARMDGYLRGKAENDLEVSRLFLQVGVERERAAMAEVAAREALTERDEAEATQGDGDRG